MTHYTPSPVKRSLAYIVAVALPVAAMAADFVGPEACKTCHPIAYESWRSGPHARAASSLPEKNRKDTRCMSCHSPEEDKKIAGVSCETCHGPGQFYAKSYVMRDREVARAVGLADPGERACGACHTESTPSLVRFDYRKKFPMIEHREGPAKRPARPPPVEKGGTPPAKAR
jgi:Zn finger protein HypA/HybF involved in hydrogenase expression